MTRLLTRAAGLAAIGLLAVTASASATQNHKLTRAQAHRLAADPHVISVAPASKAIASAAASGTCTMSNGTPTAIPDNGIVESAITVSGCTGNAGATSTVEVHITHTYRGDLVVSLIAPDGSPYVLSNRQGGSADNIDQVYTVNLGSEVANGTWRLRVQDAAAADTGALRSWTLNLGGTASTSCTGTNATDLPIPDLATVESPVTISNCAGAASATSTVEVHIVHTYRGDLVVSLIAPDGSVYVLSNRQGGSADNLDQTFSVNLSSEQRTGTWRLRVQDAAGGDTGFVNLWTLNV
jgi:subtilisin-like proprotein convertase family protein